MVFGNSFGGRGINNTWTKKKGEKIIERNQRSEGK
jgi:hypothetical protein